MRTAHGDVLNVPPRQVHPVLTVCVVYPIVITGAAPESTGCRRRMITAGAFRRCPRTNEIIYNRRSHGGRWSSRNEFSTFVVEEFNETVCFSLRSRNHRPWRRQANFRTVGGKNPFLSSPRRRHRHTFISMVLGTPVVDTIVSHV